MISPRSLTVLLVPLVLAACSRERAPARDREPTAEDTSVAVRNFSERNYERDIVFFSARGDSALLVPWSFRARSRQEGVDREIRGWLARGGLWDPFFEEEWSDPPSRAPWRILPRGPVRLVVGLGDAIEDIVFQEGTRDLEVILGDLLVEWTGQRAQTYRVHDGTGVLSESTVDGFVVDMSRSWTPQGGPPGDWGFLMSGDSLQMVMEDQAPDAAESGGDYSCWARLEFLDRQWQNVRMLWSEIHPFEAARRDVPMSWDVRSENGDVEGEIRVVAPFLEAGEGSGPILPVEALFQVAGTLSLNGRSFPVRGFFRHQQG